MSFQLIKAHNLLAIACDAVSTTAPPRSLITNSSLGSITSGLGLVFATASFSNRILQYLRLTVAR